MTTYTAFYSPKGGQGCTTAACTTALFAARRGLRTTLVDLAGGDCASVLGPLDGLPLTIVSGEVSDFPIIDSPMIDVVIFDAGTGEVPDVADRRMVVRNCYLALRRAIDRDDEPTGLIVVMEPGRALDLRDVEDVLGLPADAQIRVDPSISRAVDAGLFARSNALRSIEQSAYLTEPVS